MLCLASDLYPVVDQCMIGYWHWAGFADCHATLLRTATADRAAAAAGDAVAAAAAAAAAVVAVASHATDFRNTVGARLDTIFFAGEPHPVSFDTRLHPSSIEACRV